MDDKDPKKVKAGQQGARARWGEPRVVRLDDLTGPQRRLVLALIEAARSENERREEAVRTESARFEEYLKQKLSEKAAERLG